MMSRTFHRSGLEMLSHLKRVTHPLKELNQEMLLHLKSHSLAIPKKSTETHKPLKNNLKGHSRDYQITQKSLKVFTEKSLLKI